MDDDSDTTEGAPIGHVLREAAVEYDAGYRPNLRIVRGMPPTPDKGGGKVKTSVYLEASDVRRLGWLAEVEERPQAEVIRDAIREYRPRTADRDFALFALPPDAPTDDLTQDDIDRLMEGFGEGPG